MDTETKTITWSLGDRLAKARRLAGVSTRQMADELGVDRKTINNYEADRTKPNKATCLIWATRCNVPFEWLDEARDGGDALTRWSHPEAA